MLQLEVSPSKIREITQCKPGAIEPFLVKLRKKINTYLQQEMGHMHPLDTYDDVPDMYNYDQPEVDQNQQAPQGIYKYVKYVDLLVAHFVKNIHCHLHVYDHSAEKWLKAIIYYYNY